MGEQPSAICVGRPLITILANEGAWSSYDGRAVIAADDLFHANPYDEIDKLRVEVKRLMRENAGLRMDIDGLKAVLCRHR